MMETRLTARAQQMTYERDMPPDGDARHRRLPAQAERPGAQDDVRRPGDLAGATASPAR
jgi:hypothetical protein